MIISYKVNEFFSVCCAWKCQKICWVVFHWVVFFLTLSPNFIWWTFSWDSYECPNEKNDFYSISFFDIRIKFGFNGNKFASRFVYIHINDPNYGGRTDSGGGSSISNFDLFCSRERDKSRKQSNFRGSVPRTFQTKTTI